MARKILNTTLFIILLFLGSSTILAQTNPPPPSCSFPGGCCPASLPPAFCPAGCPPCTPVPLNGELIFLLIAGLGLLFYFFMKEKKISFNN